MKKSRTCDLVPEIQQESSAEDNANGQNDEQDLVCKRCKTRFASFVDHVDHSCHPHRCSLCNKLFQGYYELRLHKKMAHRRGTKVNDTLNISLSSTFNQQTEYVSTAVQKYSCEICDRPLKKKQPFCKNCLSTINRQGEYNLRDKSSNNSSAMMFIDKTTGTEDASRQPPRINNNGSDISEVIEVKPELMNSEDAANTVNAEKPNIESETEETVTASNTNKNSSEKTVAPNARLERLKSQNGQDISNAGIRLSRKRMLDSDGGNSVSAPKSNLQFAEGHTRSRTSKKVRNNSPVIPEKKSDMVQIDTLIRSLPDDCGILIKPCNDDGSNFRCPKCSKVFRNFRIGSVHYSLCPKNIECSKNKKILVSSQDVVWICSLCHLPFSHLSQLTKHKNSCQTTGSSQPLKSFVPESGYKSPFRRCPKCSFECVSLIKYENHPCEKLIDQYQSAVVPLKRMRDLPADYSGSYLYFECACKKIFHFRRVLQQHLRLHPHAKIRDCYRTLFIACNPSQKNEGNHILPAIKKEIISPNDEDCPNNVPNTSVVPSVQQADTEARTRKKNSLANRKASNARHIPPEQVNAQESNTSFVQILSNNLQSTKQTRSRRESVATKTIGDDHAESFEGSANSNSNQHVPSVDPNVCTCNSHLDKSDVDVKPCMKCLNDVVNEKTMKNPNGEFDFAQLKKEVEDEIRTMNEMDNREEQVDTNLESQNPPAPDLDVGLTLGYENSDIALQLIQDLHAISTPSGTRYLTPPSTPDSFQSPSHSSAAKESCILSTEYASQAGPSRLNVSPNDLASISLEKPFTDSAEFIARINETTTFQNKTEVFSSFQPQADLSLPLQPPTEPSLPLQPQADPSLPLTPQAEPLLPFQPQAEQPLHFQPQTEPSLHFQPQAGPSSQFQPSVFVSTPEETLPTVELTAEQEPTPVPPIIRHVHVSNQQVIPDAYAMTAPESETVRRYICLHCVMDFKIDSLVDHLRNKVGKEPYEEIIALYVCEEDKT